MEECGGVHIHFPTEGSGIDKVTIRGPVEEVEKAKQQLLALAEEKVCMTVSVLTSPNAGNVFFQSPFSCSNINRKCANVRFWLLRF